MIKIITFSIFLYLILLSGCSETGNTVNPVISTPPHISWIPAGLDSNMVLSLYKTKDGNLFAGTNYGLFVSADTAYDWHLVDQDISSSAVTCFADYPGGYILAGTSFKGLFISSDSGDNWMQLGLADKYVSAVAVNNNGKIFAATRGYGIFISDSLNESWMSLTAGFDTFVFFSLLITRDNKIFAGGTSVYRSDDDGNTWKLKNNGMGNWPVLSLIESNQGNIDAGTDIGGFYRSDDSGENWIRFNNGLTNTEITTLAGNSRGHIFAGTWGGGIFRSVDGGMNWADADSGLTIGMVNTLNCYDDIIYAGTFKGIFRTSSVTTSH